jgi:hypothetical protein
MLLRYAACVQERRAQNRGGWMKGTRSDSHQLAASGMGTMLAACECDVEVAREIIRS